MGKLVSPPDPNQGYAEGRRVDGNNVSKIAHTPRILEVERGHREWNNSNTGKPMDRPEYESDRD